MTKRVFFQIHWFLGITAGIVLALMGVTGAAMSFEDEISEALSPRLFAPGVPARPDLSPDRLIAKVQADHPGFYVARLDWETARDRSHSIRLIASEGRGRQQGQVDRATGAWLGEPTGAGFFHLMDELHRWLALPGGGNGIGRQITAFSALSLIFFALSGLYLRWPRQALDWRAWFVLDLRKTGRNLWRALHVVIGTWVLLFYLLSALTGLWWSYDWYRQGVTYALTGKAGGEERVRAKGDGIAPRPPIDPAWTAFRQATGDRYGWVRITQPAPAQPVKAINFDARPTDARHMRQTDRYSYDPRTFALKKRELYDRRPLGVVITQSMLELHRGAFFGITGRIVMLLTSLTMPLFTITGYLLYLSRRRKKRAAKALEGGIAVPEGTGGSAGDLVIAYASQAGTAEIRARNAALALAQGGVRAQVLAIGKLTPDLLAATRRMLFVVSTYGDGEPPDMARGFASRILGGDAQDLSHLRYGILALGDREYADFCGFGLRLEAWLRDAGASGIFPLIAMDHGDVVAEQQWHAALRDLGAADAMRGQTVIPFADWSLVARHSLNPDSSAAQAFHLQFEPAADRQAEWEAGDIVEVQPCNAPQSVDALLATPAQDAELIELSAELRAHLTGAMLPDAGAPLTNDAVRALRPLPVREYSAASIAADGTLDLVVRQVRGEDGSLGIGSGWLTAHLPVGSTTRLRVRPNPGFRVDPAQQGRPLILIGNGTGIAGLRAHLRAQAQGGHKGHWLFFGERSRAHERFFDEELSGWVEDGTLARLDRCFSRDADCGRYVQDRLPDVAGDLADWIARGAIILICGSLEGMAQGVHDALVGILGDAALERLAEEGRYRRDVY
ncbi:sulfite reductase flavoprotein subunit alpha [Sphingobium sp. CR2-8]|uniref:sulfite reductase flavoprotein subunit alpha n=1 Tax=Sphingobium sp. CR2-8 TaxID=1306534 RepID=UPI002DB842C7|nr:sulfite reductase flavoprotein subunit alpha [Sphingobium sp. CR2-8]MEC3912445.1 sulfite reductase flavoprotein subunit alpha [Sphingobium sp. CR2-8]